MRTAVAPVLKPLPASGLDICADLQRGGSHAYHLGRVEREGIYRAVTMPRCRTVLTGRQEDGAALDGVWFTGRMVRTKVP